ncbi:MAG: HAD family hydrolase [Desulfobulbaceae bacterium]|nr:HAD family hydrolase [Desulfobulbaceae bacterium]
MTALKLVILDCDGVMFSSKEANRHYYNDLLKAFSRPPMSQDELDYVHMHNVATSVQHIFRNYPEIKQEEIGRLCAQTEYAPYLRHMIMEPGLLGFLAEVKERGFTAISTNRTNTMDQVLDTFNLRSYFDLVVTASSAPRPKPAPDALYMILEYFRLPAEAAIYVGDSKLDEQHCKGTGIAFVAFNNPALEAVYYANSFAEVRQLPPLQEMLRTEPDS